MAGEGDGLVIDLIAWLVENGTVRDEAEAVAVLIQALREVPVEVVELLDAPTQLASEALFGAGANAKVRATVRGAALLLEALP